jgi:hypothetical protein
MPNDADGRPQGSMASSPAPEAELLGRPQTGPPAPRRRGSGADAGLSYRPRNHHAHPPGDVDSDHQRFSAHDCRAARQPGGCPLYPTSSLHVESLRLRVDSASRIAESLADSRT